MRVESAFGQFVKHLNEPVASAIDIDLGNVEIFDFPIAEIEPIANAEPEWNQLVDDKSVVGLVEKCTEIADAVLSPNENDVNVDMNDMSSLKDEVDGSSDKNESGSCKI